MFTLEHRHVTLLQEAAPSYVECWRGMVGQEGEMKLNGSHDGQCYSTANSGQ